MDRGMLVPLGNGRYVPDQHHNDIADQIETEITEKYMELPKDADGIPIHVGDRLMNGTERFIVCAVSQELVFRWVLDEGFGKYATTTSYYSKDCRHVCTVEDVLKNFSEAAAHDLCANPNTTVSETTIAKYAAELRELLGDEE